MKLCKFGVHNWRILEEQTEEQIYKDIAKSLSNDNLSKGSLKKYGLRVCLNCGKLINTLAPAILSIKTKLTHEHSIITVALNKIIRDIQEEQENKYTTKTSIDMATGRLITEKVKPKVVELKEEIK